MTPNSDALDPVDMMEHIYSTTNFPRLQEFMANPGKWRKNPEDLFEMIQSMNLWFKSRVKSVTYFWHGKYKCSSLEQLQNRAKQEGFTGTDLEMAPVASLTDGTSDLFNNKVDVKINIYTKVEFRLLGGVVSND